MAGDARVQSHSMSHFFHVGAYFFAQVGDHVCVTDFQSQEGVRGVLDKLRAADGGNEELRFLPWRARAVMHRAMKTFLENRPVNLAEFRSRGRILYAHNDAVRMQKIADCRSFAKEFRIRRHSESQIAVP